MPLSLYPSTGHAGGALHLPQTVFIVNPHAGNGATGREWPRISALAAEILGPFAAVLTSGPGDATRMTREHLLAGASRIVCVGGDGTLNEVVNGFIQDDRPVRPEAVLGFVPNGTGCDFCRSMPIPTELEASLATIRQNAVRSLDLGKVRFRDHQGGSCSRYFHNIASFGLGGEVVERVNRTSKAWGPFLTFIWGTLASLCAYEGKRIRLQVDDREVQGCTVLNVAVANGRYHGGGMLVAPRALADDGLFHVTVIGTMPLPLVLWHIPKLYLGGIERIRRVHFQTGRKVTAASDQRVLLDVDGEQPGTLPAEVTLLPGALRMIMKAAAA